MTESTEIYTSHMDLKLKFQQYSKKVKFYVSNNLKDNFLCTLQYSDFHHDISNGIQVILSICTWIQCAKLYVEKQKLCAVIFHINS